MMQASHSPGRNGDSTMVGGTRQRRIGGDVPYRDDPEAPVLLESLTRGGIGPSQSYEEERTSKARLPLHRQVVKSLRICYHTCCRATPQHVTDEEGPNGLFYRDNFNDMSWSCNVGTTDEHGIWLNRSDPAGTIMALMVWLLLGYSALTMTLLGKTGGIPPTLSIVYDIVCALALACHAKTTLTDPGSVPSSAVPTEAQRRQEKLSMCSQCQTFKPPFSHHCRICNRCITRMDHHCPWMNNCVGATNLKHFTLFLIYTWTCSAMALMLLGWNYFFCVSDTCTFTLVLVQLARIMTFLSVGAFLFTSSMLMNVCYGLMTGIGTIDRLKKKASNTMVESDEEPIPLKDVFGIGSYWTWPLPIDPIFDDYDRVLGYSTPQRLLREQMMLDQTGTDLNLTPSVISRDGYLRV